MGVMMVDGKLRNRGRTSVLVHSQTVCADAEQSLRVAITIVGDGAHLVERLFLDRGALHEAAAACVRARSFLLR